MARKMKFAVLPPNGPGPGEKKEHYMGRMAANGNVEALDHLRAFQYESAPYKTSNYDFENYRAERALNAKP